MNVLTIAITGVAALTGAIAVFFAVAAVAVQWNDRRGRKKDVVSEMWLYGAVFGAIFLVTAIQGGLDANYGDAVGTAVWTVPGTLLAGWLACRCIRWLRTRFNPQPAVDDHAGRAAYPAALQRARERLAKSPETLPHGFDRVALRAAKAAGFVRTAKASIVPDGAELNAPDIRDKRCKPLADALYFRESRRLAKLGLSITGLNWFRDLVKAEDGMVVAVEARGMHIGAIGSIQAGSAFFPWVSIRSATAARPGPQKGSAGGGIGAGVAEEYRKYPCRGEYLPIPGPLWFEDRRGFLDAVCRFAPDENPLRILFENTLFRFFFLWLDRAMLVFVLACFFSFYRA